MTCALCGFRRGSGGAFDGRCEAAGAGDEGGAGGGGADSDLAAGTGGGADAFAGNGGATERAGGIERGGGAERCGGTERGDAAAAAEAAAAPRESGSRSVGALPRLLITGAVPPRPGAVDGRPSSSRAVGTRLFAGVNANAL